MEQIYLNRKSVLLNVYDNAVSYIRFISMTMIIACHFLQYFNLELAWWLNVGVQIFFVIIGFLYGGKIIDKPIAFWIKQFRKILIPYWIIIVVVSAIHKLFLPTVFSWGKFISAVFCIGTIPGMEHLWFVPYILICYLLLPYLLFLKSTVMQDSTINKSISVIGVFIIFQFIGFTFNGYGMIPNRVSCFLCGMILSELQKNKSYFRRIGVIICLMALLFNVVKIYGLYVIKIENNLIFDLFTRYAHGFLGIAIFLVLYCFFENTKSNIILNISDRYSYYIYLVHQIFILGPLSLMEFTPNKAINMILICSCILISAIFLEKIVSLINNIIRKNINSIK